MKAFALGLLLLLCCYGLAGQREKTFSLHEVNAEVRQVIEKLFEQSQNSYTISPGLVGSITINIKKASFAKALDQVLNKAHASFELMGGVYVIREWSGFVSGPVPAFSLYLDRVDIHDAVKRFFAGMPNGQVTIDPDVKGEVTVHFYAVNWVTALRLTLQEVGATYERNATGFHIKKGFMDYWEEPKDEAILLNMDIKNMDFRDALKKIFTLTHMNYTVEQDVRGKVGARFRNVPLNKALLALLDQVKASYRVEDGVYNIVRSR
jgi:type II secretory pathway component GspD/PulD (secretin)